MAKPVRLRKVVGYPSGGRLGCLWERSKGSDAAARAGVAAARQVSAVLGGAEVFTRRSVYCLRLAPSRTGLVLRPDDSLALGEEATLEVPDEVVTWSASERWWLMVESFLTAIEHRQRAMGHEPTIRSLEPELRRAGPVRTFRSPWVAAPGRGKRARYVERVGDDGSITAWIEVADKGHDAPTGTGPVLQNVVRWPNAPLPRPTWVSKNMAVVDVWVDRGGLLLEDAGIEWTSDHHLPRTEQALLTEPVWTGSLREVDIQVEPF